MIAQVAYGERDADAVLACHLCDGKGEAETYHDSGVFETCRRCGGSGRDPYPDTYAYEVPDETKIGDHVLCPPSWVPGSTEQIGTVVEFGSGGYNGPVKSVQPLKEDQ